MSFLEPIFERGIKYGIWVMLLSGFLWLVSFISKMYEFNSEDQVDKACKLFSFLFFISGAVMVFCAAGWAITVEV